MINRQFKKYHHFILVFIMSLLSPLAFALSLGEMTVHSHFAEPFHAEIALPSYSPDETSSIDIHLASAKQHEAMGYAYTQTTKQFQFELKENSKGVLYIDVRSKNEIKELSISLLIEVTSVNGRIIKGYDILLTPKAISSIWENDKKEPTFQLNLSTQKSNKPNKSNKEKPQTKKSLPASIVKKTTTKKEDKVRRNEDGSVFYTRVGRGEILSTIAQRMRPNKSMHMHQVMIALYNENPTAFLNNNINLLKVGVSLHLNNISSIKDITPFEAHQQVNQYSHSSNKRHQAIDESKTDITDESHQQTIPSMKLPTKSITKAPENRLQISNNDKDFLTAGVVDDFHQEQLANLESELKNAREIIKNLDVKNKDLLERIKSLEIEINKTTKAVFSPSPKDSTDDVNSAVTDTQNEMLVINTEIAKSDTDSSSVIAILKQNQIPLSFTAAGLLALALVATRKKEAFAQLMNKFRKPKTGTDNFLDLKL